MVKDFLGRGWDYFRIVEFFRKLKVFRGGGEIFSRSLKFFSLEDWGFLWGVQLFQEIKSHVGRAGDFFKGV